MDILTVGIVTLPFKFEGIRRQRQAMEEPRAAQEECGCYFGHFNDKMKQYHGNLALSAAFNQTDDILTTAAKGIAEIITVPDTLM